MFSQLPSALANLHKREHGLTTAEYAVMLALLVVGCIIVFTMGGTDGNTARKPSTFTISFRDGSDRRPREARDARSWDPSDPKRHDNAVNFNDSTGSGSGHASAFTEHEGNGVDPREGGKNMNEDDARQALVGLLSAYPGSFPVSKATIQAASIVRKTGYIEINGFRCYLQARRFAYGTLPAGSGPFVSEKTGFFYQEENGEWTGKITAK